MKISLRTFSIILGILFSILVTSCQPPSATPKAQNTPLPPTPSASKANQPQLLFYSDRDGELSQQVMNDDGSEVAKLSFPELTTHELWTLRWIPELQAYVAILTDNSGQEDLYLINPQGSIQQQLTNDIDKEELAEYSPEANLFTYTCYYADLDICTVTPEGTNKTDLTPFQSREIDPQWSNAGEKILFVSNRAGIPGLWLVNKDGTGLQNLSNVSFQEDYASWSPDGNKILFESTRDENYEIYVMDASGDNPVNLSKHPARDTLPQWSPDGNYIAFFSERDGGTDLYVMRSDGSEVQNVTNTPQIQEGNFIWSLDSQNILFDAPLDDQYEIFSVQKDGTSILNLTNHPADDFDPQWTGQ